MDAVFSRQPRQVQAFCDIGGTVVHAGQDMAMQINQ
jgi:hypothetical protein